MSQIKNSFQNLKTGDSLLFLWAILTYAKAMEYSKTKLVSLILLRWLIGWHFFYEGMVKVIDSGWSSKMYLIDSGGFAKHFFDWIAGNETILNLTDLFNMWALTLIGFLLLAGFRVRTASIGGMFLLALYFISHPPFPGIEYIFPSDGSYFLVNKTLIELAALWVLFAFPTAHIFGLERILKKSFNRGK